MTPIERERRHQARLARINLMQVVVGEADRTRIDHERTVIERARQLSQEIDAHEATERGLAAFARLVCLADEQRGSATGRAVCEFLHAVWNAEPVPVAALRVTELTVSDDMLAVLDAFRHARLGLAEQVDGGAAHVARVLGRQDG